MVVLVGLIVGGILCMAAMLLVLSVILRRPWLQVSERDVAVRSHANLFVAELAIGFAVMLWGAYWNWRTVTIWVYGGIVAVTVSHALWTAHRAQRIK